MEQIRVLLAEDNELIALTLEEQLVALGYDVVAVARNGKEAVAFAEQHAPDVVLMDLQMPELPGDVAARQIMQRTPRPIIMLTAFSDPDHVHRAEAAGALAYVIKPVNPEELPATIEIAIARFAELQTLRTRVDTLQDTIDSRKLVERAVGILMKRLSITHDEAESRLQLRATEKKTPLKDMAQTIVDAEALLS